MLKVAVLYICTGKYSVLWKEFYESFEKFFLSDCEKSYFVFTNAQDLDYSAENNVNKIYQEPLKWPYSTLMRFHMFNAQYEKLKDVDYIFFVNANGKAMLPITKEMVLPDEDKKEFLTVVRHPAYRKYDVCDFPYDRNRKCRAYIPFGCGKVYVQGCLLGGTADAFLSMSNKIAKDIDRDLSKNVIALWHDESYLNKYILGKNYKLLSKSFADNSDKPSDGTVIWMRPKNLYFDVDTVKANGDSTEIVGFNKKLNSIRYNIIKNKIVYKGDKKEVKEEKGALFAFFWGLKNYWKIYFKKGK